MCTDIESHKRVMRRYFDAVNLRRLADVKEVMADRFIGHIGVLPKPINGIDDFLKFLDNLISAFSDLQLIVSEMVAESETVVSWVTATGTQSGDFFGVPATGAVAQWDIIHCTTIKGDKITEDRVMVDQHTLLQALAVIR
jgi:hypothetical protein